jgi:hypothetical protein
MVVLSLTGPADNPQVQVNDDPAMAEWIDIYLNDEKMEQIRSAIRKIGQD